MKNISSRTKILAVLIIIVTILGIRYIYPPLMARHDASLLKAIDAEVLTEKTNLSAIADLTRQNNGDSDTNKVILDCNVGDRNRFDGLLDKLSQNITANELTELDGLFYKCANFYAVRKAVMVSRLKLEITEYTALKQLRNTIYPYHINPSAELAAWQSVLTAETTWSDYFSKLVTEQGAIITLFRSGKTASSPEVLAILAQVKNGRSQMEILGSQIAQYRAVTDSI